MEAVKINMKEMLRFICMALALCCCQGRAAAQADEAADVIKRLFISMYNADAAGLRSVFHDSARLGSVSPDGSVRYAPISGFISYVSKLEKGVADERYEIKHISMDGKMVSAWVPYSFYRAGTFSHCGVNHILLTHGQDGWKILTITDTRRKDGCL